MKMIGWVVFILFTKKCIQEEVEEVHSGLIAHTGALDIDNVPRVSNSCHMGMLEYLDLATYTLSACSWRVRIDLVLS